ncbi:MAG: hypothetical protein V4665_02510 [Patescibacteria group bacterium]
MEINNGKLNKLKEEFIKSAIAHGESTESGEYEKANKAFELLQEIQKEIIKIDPEKFLFKELLDYPNNSVQSFAASKLLVSNPTIALPVLEKIASKEGLVAFSAQNLVEEWKAGNL